VKSDVEQRRDSGMTLPEVLISLIITATICASLAMATRVITRQSDNTQGRLNNARSEQNIGIWMPTDLASAEQVDTSGTASPCGGVCPPTVAALIGNTSNTLMLTWTGSVPGATAPIDTKTTVSYRYGLRNGEYQVIRVECYQEGTSAPTCASLVVMLHDVPAPPSNVNFVPGTPAPWVMEVSLALDPLDADGTLIPSDPGYKPKNGQRVTVTINGGGDSAGSGGGVEVITYSAGGTERSGTLETDSFPAPPTFAATRSRCGGNIGLVVDISGSIGNSNIPSVRNGIINMVNSFAGTPVRLQVVVFAGVALTARPGADGWTRYFDMLNPTDVADLIASMNTITATQTFEGKSVTGGTNWEDAMFRMFYNADGTVQSQLPGTLIFFTDGVPTRSRRAVSSSPAPAPAHPDDAYLESEPVNGATSSSYPYIQHGFNRAERIVRQFDADVDRVIGVLVGADANKSNLWKSPGPGYHWENFQRGERRSYFQGRRRVWERGYNFSYQYARSGVTFEQRVGSKWTSVARNTYLSSNTAPGEADGWRARVTGTLGNWTSMTAAQYTASNLVAGDTDGFREQKNYSSPYSLWEATTEASYNSSNSTSDESDGWRTRLESTPPFNEWVSVTESTFNANNSTADDSDGWRMTVAYSSPFTHWVPTTEELFKANNTTADNTDGWHASKVYTAPYTAWDTPTSSTPNKTILGRLITTSVPVEATFDGTSYTNAGVADLFVNTSWANFGPALKSVALAECGGTLTVQTKIGGASAADPFEYQNSVDKTVATTSSIYRSGTFDFDVSGGLSTTVTLSPINTGGLNRYMHVSWSCTSGGSEHPFTTTSLGESGGWTSVTVSIPANAAVSCVQNVDLK
jgi:Tfp pilus assembly protein PilV